MEKAQRGFLWGASLSPPRVLLFEREHCFLFSIDSHNLFQLFGFPEEVLGPDQIILKIIQSIFVVVYSGLKQSSPSLATLRLRTLNNRVGKDFVDLLVQPPV